jgi:hypothetical protein
MDGQMGEERFHFGGAHLGGMAPVVEQDVAPDPVDVGLLSANRIVFEAQGRYAPGPAILGDAG